VRFAGDKKIMTLSPEAVRERLQWRYATKVFDSDRKIPAETWAVLRETLRLAPSSFGLQPWRFVHVRDPEIRSQLRGASWNQRQVVDASHLVVLTAKTTVSGQDVEQWVQEIAKTRGVPVASLAQYKEVMLGFLAQGESTLSVPHWTANQVYLALGQLLATAAMMGIDACPMEGIDPSAYDTILGLKDSGYTTRVVCALGYRSSTDSYASAPKVRYDASELWVER
jgi:nitroreductase